MSMWHPVSKEISNIQHGLMQCLIFGIYNKGTDQMYDWIIYDLAINMNVMPVILVRNSVSRSRSRERYSERKQGTSPTWPGRATGGTMYYVFGNVTNTSDV